MERRSEAASGAVDDGTSDFRIERPHASPEGGDLGAFSGSQRGGAAELEERDEIGEGELGGVGFGSEANGSQLRAGPAFVIGAQEGEVVRWRSGRSRGWDLARFRAWPLR